MKYFILLFIQVLLLMQIVSAQQTTPQVSYGNQEKANFFMKKKHSNNTVGWVCLGTGIGLGIIGISEGLADATNISYNTVNNSKAKGTGLFIAGNVVALASIPFFISAHKNKRKASLALKGENVSINKHVLINSNYTALAITIHL